MQPDFFKNYFVLNRITVELKPLIQGGKIISIFTQEKNKLIVVFSLEGKEVYLEICVNSGSPYLILKQNYSRAKKNTFELFRSLLNSNITGIFIADNDRIITIATTSGTLFFTIRGKFTNVFVIDIKEGIEAFLKIDEEKLISTKEELLSKIYIDDFHDLEIIDENKELNIESFQKKHPIVSKDIIQEVKSRSGDELSNLKKVIGEIFHSNPAVLLDIINYKISISFDRFYCNQELVSTNFGSIVEAFDYYLSKKDYLDEKNRKVKRIEKHLERQLKKISSKINDLRGLLDRGSKEEEYKKIGNLLLINLHHIKSGMSEITLEDIYQDNTDIKVKLNAKLSAKENADWYFSKSKSDRILIQKSEKLLKDSQHELEKLKLKQESLNRIDSIKEINLLMKDLKMKENEQTSQSTDIRIKFKHYKISGKYNVYVGKDSANNDLLTTRFAKQNDYWFHARSVSGSHVVLKVENTKEGIPKDVIKKAASLAAYHSKAKTAGLVPVSYTFKKYVVKRKGMPIGQVSLLREDTVLVKPEIPKDCEYITEE